MSIFPFPSTEQAVLSDLLTRFEKNAAAFVKLRAEYPDLRLALGTPEMAALAKDSRALREIAATKKDAITSPGIQASLGKIIQMLDVIVDSVSLDVPSI